MRFGRAMAETNNLKRNEAVQTLLAGAINDALTAATDFLQEFVIAELRQDRFVLRRRLIALEQTRLEQTGRAILRDLVRKDFRPAFVADRDPAALQVGAISRHLHG